MKCISCGNEIDEKKYIRTFYSKESKTSYKLYHCNKCDLQFWTPLEFIKTIYEEEKIGGYKFFHEGIIFLQDNHKFGINLLKKNNIKGKLVDIGCGNGAFIKEAEKLGFDVYGIDIDKESINTAKEIFGLKKVYNMNIEEFVDYCKKINLKFDVVTFFEVLEHQVDPKMFIESVKTILSNSGVIIGSVPNRNRLLSFLRELNNTDFPPHHFLWFSEKSIKNLFNNCGFDCEVRFLKRSFREFYNGIFSTLYILTNLELFNTLYDYTHSNKNKLYSILGKLFRVLFFPVPFISLLMSLQNFHILFICKLKK